MKASGDTIPVIAMPRLNPLHQERLTVAEGASVADIVGVALPTLRDLTSVRVVIGDSIVPSEMWRYVRPKAGTAVIVRPLPGNDLRSVLSLVVLVASVAVAGPLAGALTSGLELGAIGTSAATALTTAGLAFAGTALINSLIPLRQEGPIAGPQGSPAYSISGFKNIANPGGVIPNILGKHRYAPPYAMLPSTAIDVEKQYVRVLFNLGYGPYLIEDIRLGETNIGNYGNYSIEVLPGYPTDPVQSFFPTQVIEDAPNLEFPGGEATTTPRYATTATGVIGFVVDVIFPQGLGFFNDAGGIDSRSVSIQIRYKLTTDAVWTAWGTPVVTAASKDAVRRSFAVGPIAAGQYDVEVTRVSATDTDLKIIEGFNWVALRGVRDGAPLANEMPLALIGLVMQASEQLNGVIDDLNCLLTRICADWDSASGTWIDRPTQNPASLFRYVLQSNANAYPKTDAQIDLEQLQDWHEYCDEWGFAYNRIHDYDSSLMDVLRDVAAAGRAAPRHDGSKWGVVIDRPQGVVTGHITPRNSWGFSGERTYLRTPDAFRVPFIDETNGYRPSERVVIFPDFAGTEDTAEIIEDLSLPGITDPDLVYMEARRRQEEALQRVDRYTVNMDIEAMPFAWGDLAALSHEVLDRTQFPGRVSLVAGNAVTIDTPVEVEIGESYACRFRKAGGETLLRGVESIEVGSESSVLHFQAGGELPEVGDLAMFGRSTLETRSVVVLGVEAMENLSVRLTLVDSAESISDLPYVPPFEPSVPPAGTEADPAVPEIFLVSSGLDTPAVSIDYTTFYSLAVEIHAGTGGGTPVTFELQHKLSSDSTWQSDYVSAGAQVVYLSDYVGGNVIDLKARAINFSGGMSAFTDTVNYTVVEFPYGVVVSMEDSTGSPDDAHYVAMEDESAVLLEGY